MNHFCGAAAAVLLLFVSAQAAAVSIEPGQWETTSTVTLPIMPQPQVHTSQQCMEEAEFDPEDFNTDPDVPCELENVREEGNTISWDLTCPDPSGEGNVTGSMEFTSHGDSVTGKGNMTMSMMGQDMTMTVAWQGKRVGDCPQ